MRTRRRLQLACYCFCEKKKFLKRESSIKVKRNVFGNTHMAIVASEKPWRLLIKNEGKDDDQPLRASLSANALKRLRESETKGGKPQVAKCQKPKDAKKTSDKGQKPEGGQKRKKKNGLLEFEEYSPEFLKELAKRGITWDMIQRGRNDMLSEG